MPHLTPYADTNESLGYAAIFVDFENVFYFLRNEYGDLPDLTEYTLEILRNLRSYIENEYKLSPIVRYAYADFEKLNDAPLGSLYLMGIEIRNVLGAQHKNAADMRLCIDAMQVLYTRPDIKTFVFVAGDRDYIPVIQHIQTQARTVKAVAFRGNLSGDLLQNIGDSNFIDAKTLLAPESQKKLEQDAAYAKEAERIREENRLKEQEKTREAAQAQASDNGGPHAKPAFSVARQRDGNGHSVEHKTWFHPSVKIVAEDQKTCLEIMLFEYGNHPEIWLRPFLRKLNEVFPNLADYERKALLSDLEIQGAIKIEIRSGDPYNYSVIIVNYNHPSVRELNPG